MSDYDIFEDAVPATLEAMERSKLMHGDDPRCEILPLMFVKNALTGEPIPEHELMAIVRFMGKQGDN